MKYKRYSLLFTLPFALVGCAGNDNSTSVVPTVMPTQASLPAVQIAPTAIPQPVTPAQPLSISDERTGVTYEFYAIPTALHCRRLRNLRGGVADFVGAVFQGKTVTNYVPVKISGGTMHCIFQNEDGLFDTTTQDDGEHWDAPILIATGIKLSGAISTQDRDGVTVYGEVVQANATGLNVGDKALIEIRYDRSKSQWAVVHILKG